jgi:ribokinase
VVSAARLTVLGSLNMDISVTVPRLPAPGVTVLGGGATFAPGGKGANQAVAAARLGASVRMVGCVGDDDFGRALRAALRAEGVGDGVRTVPGVPTGLAMITVDEAGENIITVAPGANREVGAAEIAAVRETPADVLVISAEIPVAAIRAALAAGRADHADDADGTDQAEDRPLRVLNLAPAPPEAAELIAAGADWLVVNESEASAVLGRPVTGLADAARAAADLAQAGARHAVVTAGAAGAAYCGARAEAGASAPGQPGSGVAESGLPGVATVPGFPVRAVDSVGAGDTFVGALAAALAAGAAPLDAVVAAAAAGATAATRPGTQSGMPRPADVLAATGHAWPVPVSRVPTNSRKTALLPALFMSDHDGEPTVARYAGSDV